MSRGLSERPSLDCIYPPGLATAVFVLLPIYLYTFGYVIQHGLMHPIWWVFSFLYMLFGLVVAQQIVPAFTRLKQFFVSEYLPACYAQVGAWQLPHGEEGKAGGL